MIKQREVNSWKSVSYAKSITGNPVTRENIMLNEGTTAKTYAPYWQ
jgi:hypothetical protein